MVLQTLDCESDEALLIKGKKETVVEGLRLDPAKDGLGCLVSRCFRDGSTIACVGGCCRDFVVAPDALVKGMKEEDEGFLAAMHAYDLMHDSAIKGRKEGEERRKEETDKRERRSRGGTRVWKSDSRF